MVNNYILDTNVISNLTWYELLGVDKINNGSGIILHCDKYSKTLYKCFVKDTNGRLIKEVEISASLFNTLKNSSYVKSTGTTLTIDRSRIDTMKRVRDKIYKICVEERNNCLTPPEIPTVTSEGTISDTLKMSSKLFTIFPDEDSEFNKTVAKVLNEYNIKILLDKNMFPDEKLYNNVKKFLEIYYNNIVEDRKLKPIYKISNGEFTVKITDNAIQIYDKNGHVNRVILITDDLLERNPALKSVINSLKSGAYKIEEINEAIKNIYYIKNNDGTIKVKKFDPEKTYVDVYLQAVAHDNTYVVTMDKDIEGAEGKIEPSDKKNIVLLR